VAVVGTDRLAKGVLTQLRDKGQVTRGWVGVQVQPVTPELAMSFAWIMSVVHS
jgi:S1-C subfamily serine protease